MKPKMRPVSAVQSRHRNYNPVIDGSPEVDRKPSKKSKDDPF